MRAAPPPPHPAGPVIWCNGAWLDPARFGAGVADRGWTLGLGLFETMLGVDGRLVFGGRHLARLEEGCRRFGWELPWRTAEDLAASAGELMARAGLARGDARIRLAVSGGSGPLADLTAGADRLVWMTASPAAAVPTSLAVNLSPWRRNQQGALAGLKCASYAENLVALDQARRDGFGETLMLNTAGELCEAATANVFLVMNGGGRTPSLDSGCLPGVARAVVIELLRGSGRNCEEGRLTVAELLAADEVFLTSAVRGPVAVTRVGQRRIPPGPVCTDLREAWQREVRRLSQG